MLNWDNDVSSDNKSEGQRSLCKGDRVMDGRCQTVIRVEVFTNKVYNV